MRSWPGTKCLCSLDIWRRSLRVIMPRRRLQDSAQGFNPGIDHHRRCALNGRQIERPNNLEGAAMGVGFIW
jgi:hypothetical protein